MTKKELTSKIDDLLKKFEFYKKGSLWNRDSTEFVDVIDLQISKSKDMFTINAGVACKFVLQTCWGVDGSITVDEASCTVRARLGDLIHGRDLWWSLADIGEADEVLNAIEDAATPYLQFNHSIDNMIETLENDPASRRYPPGIIYLALLYYRNGEHKQCSDMFKSMNLSDAWAYKAAEILDRLDCGDKLP